MSETQPSKLSEQNQAEAAQFYVEIVETATDRAVQRMGPMGHARAIRVDSGASINLNHEAFHTRIVEAE